MTIEAAILSFYLLFPAHGDDAAYFASYARAAGKSENPVNKQSLVRDITYMLDHPRIALTGTEIDTSNIPNLMAELGLASKEQQFYDSDGSLRATETGVERTSYGNSPQGRTTVFANDFLFTQTIRDEQNRITEKTVWQNARTSDKIKMLSKMTWTYKQDSQQPSFYEEEKIAEQTAKRIYYKESGLPEKEQDYVIYGGAWHSSGRKVYAYDDQGRLVSESDFSNYRGVPDTKMRYSYTEFSSKPNTFYYENGMLRVKTEYSGEEDWIETTYFDRHYNIQAIYKNGRKVGENVYTDGVLKRSRTYD